MRDARVAYILIIKLNERVCARDRAPVTLDSRGSEDNFNGFFFNRKYGAKRETEARAQTDVKVAPSRRGPQRTIGFPFELYSSSRLSGGGPIRVACAREHMFVTELN